MTLAAFLRPAGKFSPIFSNFSRRERPPFFDFALRRLSSSSFHVFKKNKSNKSNAKISRLKS